ncbi:MAG: zinc-finger domain-containing protein [Betaproteobacteria bacterium]|jgi:uncharacterized Zn-finger protein
MTTPTESTAPAAIEVDASEGPVFCPNPRMPIWSSHPRVFLDVAASGEARCPYCGTAYRLKPGSAPRAHH